MFGFSALDNATANPNFFAFAKGRLTRTAKKAIRTKNPLQFEFKFY